MANNAAAGEMLEITLPDGSKRQYPRGTLLADIVKDIGPGLARAALAVRLNGRVLELFRPLEEGGELAVLTFDDEDGRYSYRHTASHVLAQAVKRLFPEAKLGIGPPIEDGFYYDIDVGRPLTPDDLEKIEAEMERIRQEDLPLERFELPREEAIRLMEEKGETYKVELIHDLPPDEVISFYRQGEFVDLCRGPHVASTGRLKHLKLLHVAGAYWRGDETQPMLQRIYGTAFERKQDLEQFLWRREEAKRRDHRRLGPELDLFHFDDVAPGYVFWHPKGTIIYNELVNFSRQLQEGHGYQEVRTPDVMKVELWQRSGHWDYYRENMFLAQQEDTLYGVKPMNCPGHCLIFRSRVRSYRELPLRLAEYGHLSRFERSGALHGLLRVRGMVQDDAHLFITPEQIEDEIAHCLQLVEAVYGRTFEVPYEIDLSTRPEEFMGDPALWDRAEAMLESALNKAGRRYNVAPGEGAFYGPKLDFHFTDSLGRRWQCATVQLDFQMPEKFDLTYVGTDGRPHRPVMIHRAILGTLERFIGVLIEHYAGAFPTWLAPVQVKIMPVSQGHRAYAQEVVDALERRGVRVVLDDRDEKLGYKIRQAQAEKVPYMLVVGDREAAEETVSVRSRDGGDVGSMPLGDFVAAVAREIRERHNRLTIGAPAAAGAKSKAD